MMNKLTFLQNLKQRKWVFASAAIAAIVTVLMIWGSITPVEQNQPLYWVAPMDPNFRRDEPGLSPMGMELVPVYEEPSANSGPGVVTISPEVQQQMGVRTAVAEFGQLELALQTYGRIVFDQTLIHQLSPRVTGWVDMLFVATEGESVKRGQPLYAIYSKELIEAQEAFLKVFQSGNRTQILKAESHLRALKVDEQTIDQIKSEGVAQQSVVFRAPIDGVVGMLKVAEDYFVEPGDLIMAIGTLENIWAEFNIFASQAALLKPRQLLTFSTPSYPGLVWQAEVDYIYPALSNQERSLRFRASVENPMMRLKPNMHIQGSVVLPERDEALLVPRHAVIDVGEQKRVVMNLGEGRFKSVAVEVGQSNRESIEILEGLEEGDRVVSSAHFLIDSESSKTSDFRRMLGVDDSAPKYPTTWVKAKILAIDLSARTLQLDHERIDAWNMPGMTMNFQAEDSLQINKLEIGDLIQARITDGDPLFRVLEIKTHFMELDE